MKDDPTYKPGKRDHKKSKKDKNDRKKPKKDKQAAAGCVSLPPPVSPANTPPSAITYTPPGSPPPMPGPQPPTPVPSPHVSPDISSVGSPPSPILESPKVSPHRVPTPPGPPRVGPSRTLGGPPPPVPERASEKKAVKLQVYHLEMEKKRIKAEKVEFGGACLFRGEGMKYLWRKMPDDGIIFIQAENNPGCTGKCKW